MEKDLFHIIMEADGDDMEAFDDSSSDAPVEEAPATNDDFGGDDLPPEPASDTSSDDMGDFGDDSFGDDSSMDDSTDDENTEDGEGKSISSKVNNILNQELYRKMVKRNGEVSGIIEDIQTIIPALPYDIVQSNDQHVGNLKTALQKGQSYVINDFINLTYGENLLFYQKLDSLYNLLMTSIDKNLKRKN